VGLEANGGFAGGGGREAQNKDGLCSRAVLRFVAAYCECMREYAPMPVLQIVRHQVSRLRDVTPVHIALQKALRATPLHTLDQLTEPVRGREGTWFGQGFRSGREGF